MYYEIIDNNKNKWMLLLHCICANMNIFNEYIEDLSLQYNILLVDLPGHGKSKNPTLSINFQAIANELIKILDSLNISKTNIWGISLGAIVAEYMLKLFPTRIDTIIFESPAFMINNIFLKVLFNIFNKIKIVLPNNLYLKSFIYMVIPNKKMKIIRQNMYAMLENADLSKISKWLTEMNAEYANKNFDVLNKSKLLKTYIIGEKDYIFKDGTIKNIIASEYNKIYVKNGRGHLCYLEAKLLDK